MKTKLVLSIFIVCLILNLLVVAFLLTNHNDRINILEFQFNSLQKDFNSFKEEYYLANNKWVILDTVNQKEELYSYLDNMDAINDMILVQVSFDHCLWHSIDTKKISIRKYPYYRIIPKE